ncbi:hypothetical protein G1C96_1155 [Bifidobacterium sp. DSM 109958]|uniref:DUF4244 domain-containing protein n=1 Tax=Bifidobacterium moraviense TaxID=2675323 RepID=A0A7Y0HXU4_9BIFI|nr:DUF4244 domain-containing protein [Bifidobacterium sp. DSM 109958]NMN00576.1 hypothetical protein [Bifidobacterium sp. DSM 109958]
MTLSTLATAPASAAVTGPSGALQRLRGNIHRNVCLLDARLRTMAAEPERGAATVEYALVIVAAAAFAGVLLVVIKSGFAKTLLTDLIKNALGGK